MLRIAVEGRFCVVPRRGGFLRTIRHCDVKRRARYGSVVRNGIDVRVHCRWGKLALVGLASQDRGARPCGLVVLHRGQIRKRIHAGCGRLPRWKQFRGRGSSTSSSHVWPDRGTHRWGRWFRDTWRSKNVLRKRGRSHSSPPSVGATTPKTLLRWTGRRCGWRRRGSGR